MVDSQLEKLIASIRVSPLPFTISDPRQPDNPLVAANAAYEALTGYSEAESIGRNGRFLQGPASDERARAELRAGIAERRPTVAVLVNYKKDGTAFLNAVMIAPVLDDAGDLAHFIGTMADRGDDMLPHLEAARRSREAVAALSMRQREVLHFLVRGYSNKQIARQLGLSPETVKKHRGALMERLNVRSLAEAIRIAIEAKA